MNDWVNLFVDCLVYADGNNVKISICTIPTVLNESIHDPCPGELKAV